MYSVLNISLYYNPKCVLQVILVSNACYILFQFHMCIPLVKIGHIFKTDYFRQSSLKNVLYLSISPKIFRSIYHFLTLQQAQSKWLREEGDDTWETRIGVSSNSQQNFRREFLNNNEGINQVSVYRDEIGKRAKSVTQKSSLLLPANLKGFNTNANILYGVIDEESDTLQIEKRKRRRGDLGGLGQGDTVTGYSDIGPNDQINNDGAGISNMDLIAPTECVLAELAKQTSQSK